MITVYWLFLLFGGTLLVFSIFAGTDSDADVDFDVDSDMDFDFDADADLDMDAGGEGLAAAGCSHLTPAVTHPAFCTLRSALPRLPDPRLPVLDRPRPILLE